MKNSIIMAICGLGLLLGQSAVAADTQTIATIDMQTLMQSSPQVQKLRNELTKQFEPKEKEIVTASEKLRGEFEKFRRDGSVMTAENREKTEKELIAKQQALQIKQMALRDELMKSQNETFKAFITKVEGILEKISAEKKYTLVINKAALAYAPSSLDITSEVLKALDSSKK